MSDRFELFRITPEGKEFLSHVQGHVTFDTCSDHVQLNFVNGSGHLAKFLVNGTVYFPVEIVDGKTMYLYYLNGKYSLEASDVIPGRIFFYIPPSGTYPISTNVSGFFFVSGQTIPASRALLTSLTDRYYLSGPEILSRNCVSNCGGKTCNEDNGCGLPCECSPGKICSEDGSCQDKPKASPCSDNYPCGEHNGQCYGNCPLSYQCIQGPNGKYHCSQYIDGTTAFGIFILVILLAVVLYLIVLSLKSSMYSVQTSISTRNQESS